MRQFSQSFVIESAAKAKTGNPAALDFLISYVAEVIATSDRHDLCKIFRKYNEDTQQLAEKHAVSRKQIVMEMEVCHKAARNGDATSILRIRRYLLDLCLKAPYAIWMSITDCPLKELPGGPGKRILLPELRQ